MQTRRFTLITFDLDDTLWDIRPVLVRAEQRVAAWFSRHCPAMLPQLEHTAMAQRRREVLRARPDLQHHIGTLRREVMRLGLLACGQDDASAISLAHAAFEEFLAARHEVEPFEAVDAALTELGRHYTLAALTNGNADIFRVPLGRHFAFAFRAEDLGSSKPDPAHFHAAMHAASVDTARMLHIGDNPEHDIEGARRLGIATIWFNPDGREWPLPDRPDASFAHFTELPALVAAMDQGT